MNANVRRRVADPVTIAAVTRKNANHSEEAIRKLGDCCPEVNGKVVNLKFPGRRQRDTPATDAKAGGPFKTAWRGDAPERGRARQPLQGTIEIVMLLPEQQAARVRRQAAELPCPSQLEQMAPDYPRWPQMASDGLRWPHAPTLP